MEESMATFARNVDVEWTGNLMEGSGTAKAGTGAFTLPVTFPSRIAEKGDGKTTPEELMAASHAVCYAMVLTNTITKQGGKVRKIRVTSTVTADKSDAGIKVVSSHLKAVVEGLEGIDKATIKEVAIGAERGCPISNAIRGSVAITVDAQAV
jgi:osmotically inducible protein OsmC